MVNAVSPQLVNELLQPRLTPTDAADALDHHYRSRQQRMAVAIMALLAVCGTYFGIRAGLRGDPLESVILLFAALSNGAMLLGRGHLRRPQLALQWAAGSLVALYFYLLIWGGWAGTGALWGLALAPAAMLILGPHLGAVVFVLVFLLTGWVFWQGDGPAWAAQVLPGDLTVFESRYLCVLGLLGIAGFLLEYDRHRVIGELLKAQVVLRELATVDELTGIANRRAMQQTLLHAERRGCEQRSGYGLVLGDIDLFKQINDSHGHECGDRVIAAVATALQGALREGDVVARWGGEEFLVLLPDTDRQGALAVAEKLRAAVARVTITYSGESVMPTLSFGVIAAHWGERVDQSIRRADRALYRAKQNGRNCIVEG